MNDVLLSCPLLVGVLMALTIMPAQAADLAAGEAAFRTRCGACHAIEPDRNRTGPSLFGVVGRKAGSGSGFRYSSALRHSGLTWDQATLDKYLAGPRALVPGTSKAMPGVGSETQRADLIAYLETLH